MTELSPVELMRYAPQYCPTFVLHSREAYRPTRMDRYLSECDLVDSKLRQVVANRPLTSRGLDEAVPAEGWDKPHGRYNLAIRGGKQNDVVSGCAADRLDDDVPLIVHGVRVGGRLYIHYVPFYAYNGPSSILGGALWLGQHEADIEHVTAVLTADGTSLEGYYLSRHGDEAFFRTDQLDVDPDHHGRHMVYVALGSHAHYPTVGANRRLYGCTYDMTDDGTRWRPATYMPVVLPSSEWYSADTMGFMWIMGHMGDGWTGGSVSNLPLKAWLMTGHVDGVDEEYLTDRKMVEEGQKWIKKQ